MERKEGASVEAVKDNNINDMDIYENDIDLYLHLFCENNGIQNMRQESQAVWNSCLRYIYNNVFKNTDILKSKDIRHIDNNSIPSTFNAYNYNTVLYVLDIYIYNLCFKYDKEISIIGFSTLTGIDESIIYDWGKDPGSLSSKVYKKLHDLREESLSNKLVTGNKNPIGIIATLRRHYSGWDDKTIVRHESDKGAALSVEQLPKLGQIAQNPRLENKENQDNAVDV